MGRQSDQDFATTLIQDIFSPFRLLHLGKPR